MGLYVQARQRVPMFRIRGGFSSWDGMDRGGRGESFGSLASDGRLRQIGWPTTEVILCDERPSVIGTNPLDRLGLFTPMPTTQNGGRVPTAMGVAGIPWPVLPLMWHRGLPNGGAGKAVTYDTD